jgi:hypothetical protein
MAAIAGNGQQQNHVFDPMSGKMTEEKVELKEVHATGEKPTDAEQQKGGETKPASKFRNLFTRSKSSERNEKTNDEKEKEKSGVGAEQDGKPKEPSAFVKKTKQIFSRRPKTEGEEKPPMTIGLNLLDRDEKGIHDDVKLQFEHIFAEPDGYHSFECLWRAVFVVFTMCRKICYMILTCVFGIPIALFWGLMVAVLMFLQGWCCMPGGRAAGIICSWPAKIWAWLVRSLMDPMFRSCGLCFGAIQVHHRTYTMNPQDAMVHVA